MAANYDFRENPNPKGDNEPQALHPRIVVKDTIRTKQIIRDICHDSSLTEADVVAVLSAIEEKTIHYLHQGCNVELGDMGYFSATLKSRPVMDKKEIRSMSVHFDNVNFRSSASFKNKLRTGGTLIRNQRIGFKHSKNLSEEKRKELVENYLKQHPFMTRSDYSDLTGRLKGIALKDLKKWVEEGYLKTFGRRSNLVYMRRD